MCIGRNYSDHISEVAETRAFVEYTPEYPVFFTKPYTAIIGPEANIIIDPQASTQVDWEAELAVVIGKQGRHISEKEALDYVFGYMCANDVTARDMQKNHEQWFIGKSLDTFCPLGPWLVTADEIGDPQNLEIQLRVNGETKQHANTKQMIFKIAQQIAWLSKGITLEPGDIILTGTPSGVGFARKPPEYLKVGDVVEVEIEKIGILRNHVVEATS
jgi:2-keto-4-pentenoate hydratase/2-oxohepta-3-ene-1,7-dioic acid hydratase in catechol pathway